jgi:protein-tyrosine kinase
MERIQAAIDKARARRVTEKPQGAAAGVVSEAVREIVAANPPEGLAEAWSGLSVFAPKPAHLEDNRVVAYQPGPLSGPFEIIRTKMLLQMRANSWRRVAITSPTSDCGKTTIAVNLAFCLARQSDLRVMLVDLDLRRPAVAATLGVTRDLQLSRALAGTAPAEAQMMRIGANFAFAVNKVPTVNSAELLQGVGAAEVLDRIEARYAPDIILFDLAPMLVADDTIGFLDQVDCALLVAAAERSTLEEVGKCEADLAARTNPLGVVLNKCRYRDNAESYGYGY